MNELYHYGIKRRSGRYPYGSGDRPFQSATRSELKKLEKGKERSEIFRDKHTIPKGTNVYLISKNPNLLKTPTVSYLNIDRDKDIGFNQLDKRSKTYERKMVLTEDLKVPSRDHLKETIDQEIERNPKLLDSAINSIVKDRYPHGVSDDEELNTKKLSKEEYNQELFERTAKSVNNQPLEIRFTQLVYSFGNDNELKNAVFDKLSEEGYNGIVDESKIRHISRTNTNSSGIVQYQKGADPIILFDPDKSTRLISEREITEKDEKEARKNSLRWQIENGRLKGERKYW